MRFRGRKHENDEYRHDGEPLRPLGSVTLPGVSMADVGRYWEENANWRRAAPGGVTMDEAMRNYQANLPALREALGIQSYEEFRRIVDAAERRA
jgi:hypothetical protein